MQVERAFEMLKGRDHVVEENGQLTEQLRDAQVRELFDSLISLNLRVQALQRGTRASLSPLFLFLPPSVIPNTLLLTPFAHLHMISSYVFPFFSQVATAQAEVRAHEADLRAASLQQQGEYFLVRVGAVSCKNVVSELFKHRVARVL